VYEELLFRLILVSWLSQHVSEVSVVIVSSLLFGLWHVKNYRVQGDRVTVAQVLYAGLILGPILAILTSWYGNILPAILLHAINNLLSPVSQKWLKRLRL
jgi:membrane protease YdiL (CAAX protease family)